MKAVVCTFAIFAATLLGGHKGVGSLFSRASGPSARPQGRCHSLSPGHASRPRLLSKGSPPLYARSNGQQFSGRLWAVRPCDPTPGTIKRPVAQPRGELRSALRST